MKTAFAGASPGAHAHVQRAPARVGVKASTTRCASPSFISSLSISPTEFLLFQKLIWNECGIWLSREKTALLVGRLAVRLRTLGVDSFGKYHEVVVKSDDERACMLDLISTNETHFFRESKHFEFLCQQILPEFSSESDFQRQRRIRVWSAGCSSGQEPYSLAMVLQQAFPDGSGWDITIKATDLSNRVLEIASRGEWPAESADEIPRFYLQRFMLRGVRQHAGKIRARSEIRSMIEFFRLNLKAASYPFTQKFDLIFCRNVLIYFDPQTRLEVLGRLLNHLRPGGYLFLGHAESIPPASMPTRMVIPTVYQFGEHSDGSDAVSR